MYTIYFKGWQKSSSVLLLSDKANNRFNLIRINMINSFIQWTDDTVNFWMGCLKVGIECLYCYWYRDAEKYGRDPIKLTRTKDPTFYAALKWKEPKKIFTCSWSDFFIDQADEWRSDCLVSY